MPKFAISIDRRQEHTVSFTIKADDEDNARIRVQTILDRLEHGHDLRSLGIEYAEWELERDEYELYEISKES